ncbi:CoA transferase [Janibacter melonis]|uniref:CoA transferase n=1 Tax=Janibacter melonis TaxID=262209 RepID=A0A5P8FJ67_9MICO|nr:CoA transferase [Janibacter melonis]QFQ29074.2 CoA transferase [Janibacter melonis]
MTAAHRPLDGVRVVSLAVNLPGPLAAARLTSMGAAVTKVEPPTGDPLALVAPTWYTELVGGQEVVRLDLKDPADRAALEDRLAGVDVLLTSMRPSALERLGLPESVERHGLLLVEVIGYDGDRAEEAGHDLTYQASRGMVAPPTMPLVPMVDVLGSERAVSATLAGLRVRESLGAAVHERVVLDEVADDAAASLRHGLTGPGAVLGGALPGYAIYATSDGYVAVGAIEPHFAARLAEHVGSTRSELETAFASRPSAHWEQLGREHDVPVVVVRDPGSA